MVIVDSDVVTKADSLVLRPKAAVVLRTLHSGASTLMYSVTAFLALIVVVIVQFW